MSGEEFGIVMQLAGWLSLIAGVAGLAASYFLARPTLRTRRDEVAVKALSLLGTIDRAESETPNLTRAVHDLNWEILGKFLENRADTRRGFVLLGIAFTLLVAHSVIILLDT